MSRKILVLNPGSTSTRIGVYDGESCLDDCSITHDNIALEGEIFPDQYYARKKAILDFIDSHALDMKSFSAIAARGGRLKPVPSGVYSVNGEMVAHAKAGLQGQHPANLAVVIANDISREYNVPAYTVDPISVDEFSDFVRITGLRGLMRSSLSHALNMKAVAKKGALQLGVAYEEFNTIVVHIGGGGSVSAHVSGRMTDLHNSDQEGAFAVERAGGLPTLKLLEYLETQKIALSQAPRLLAHEGGLYSHFNTRDIREIEKTCMQDPASAIILKAYVYSLAKSVCSFLPLFQGFPDAVCITGGAAHSTYLCEQIKKWIGFMGPVMIFPGELEMETLAGRVNAVITGKEVAQEY